MIGINQTEEPLICPNCGSNKYNKIDEWTSILEKHIDVWECECGMVWKEEYIFSKWEPVSIPVK
jgi:uncharacterized Zn finger protein